MIQDESFEKLVSDVEIVEDTPLGAPQGGRGYTPAADAGRQPESVDLAHGQPSRGRGRAIAGGALAGAWLLLNWRLKVAIWVLGPIVVLLLLLGVVTFVAPVLIGGLFYPPVWPLVVLAVTWLVARRRRDGRGPVQHIKALTAAAHSNMKAVRTGVLIGAVVGLSMGVVGYLQGDATILDGLLTICGTTAAAAIAVSAYQESRS